MPYEEPESRIKPMVLKALDISSASLKNFRISKKAVDARRKNRITFVYSVEFDTDAVLVQNNRPLPDGWVLKTFEPFSFQFKKPAAEKFVRRPVIIGTGPCGLFCGLVLAEAGLKPILFERGKSVDDRFEDVERFMQTGNLNPESNIQFGEGGAGTFSDGKLYTLIHDPHTQYVFDRLIRAGAPQEIASDARPHIGTDRLRNVARNLRTDIQKNGGEVHFESRLSGCTIRGQQIEAIEINGHEQISADTLILSIGHSARDTVQMLFDLGLVMEPKIFSMGVRIEHPREWIEKSQYGEHWDDLRLPSAIYKMAVHLPENHSVYTFCMCPGGQVISAASEPEYVATNGMSTYKRDGSNSNSALLVNVPPGDFGSHPLAGIEFQRTWERMAFQSGGGNYSAPVQLTGDFLNKRISREFRSVLPTYRPGTRFADLRECLPGFVYNALSRALPLFGRKLKGFSHPDALLTGVETRSSSPVRISRDESLESSIHGIFPAGEGAGYAGGIVSAAVDGIRVAEKILTRA
jgi:uncharacterized FAD-dependent dehydrogenase